MVQFPPEEHMRLVKTRRLAEMSGIDKMARFERKVDVSKCVAQLVVWQ